MLAGKQHYLSSLVLRRDIVSFLFALSLLRLTGCTSGPMCINEQYFLGASDGANRVYYRVTISGQTELGVSEFREGWFPSHAVDALFGDVSDNAGKQQNVRDELQHQIDDATLIARSNYLARAVNPDTSLADLHKALEALRRVRLTAQDSTTGIEGSVVMEYQPNADLVLAHSDEKEVLVLSSNPDEIISKLATLSEGAKTDGTLDKFVKVLAFREGQNQTSQSDQRVKDKAILDLKVQQNSTYATVIGANIDNLNKLASDKTPDRDKLLGQIDSLVNLLEIAQQQQGGGK